MAAAKPPAKFKIRKGRRKGPFNPNVRLDTSQIDDQRLKTRAADALAARNRLF